MTAVYTLAQSCLQQDNISSLLSQSPSNSVSSISGSPVAHSAGICIAPFGSRNRRGSSVGNNSNNGYINNYHHSHHVPSSNTTTSTRHTSHVNGSTLSNSNNNGNAAIFSVSPPKHRSSAPLPVASTNSSLTNLILNESRKESLPLAVVPAPAPAPAPAGIATAIRAPAPAPSAIADLPNIHSLSVIETFNKVLADVDIDECEAAGENAFLVCDLARVWERYLLWQRELGDRVEPFFAVKCNPDPVIISLMARLGLGFDCASHQEISTVLKAGVHPDKIIYANPCKASSFIRHAAKSNVDMMTFDNADELSKVSKFHKNAKMVLRILTDDSGSLCKLGLKFGAPLSEVKPLLLKAKELNVEVIGISFHVGSGCTNPNLFADAVERAKWAFDVGAELGFKFTFLDVGGGFGGENFVEIASILRPAIERCFPKEEGVRVIAEPGRYFVAEAFEMATNVIARRGKGTGTLEDEDMAPPAGNEEVDEEEEAIVMCE